MIGYVTLGSADLARSAAFYDAVLAEGVDLGAPGEGSITTFPGGVYGFVSGSSAAAAYASGVAALCLSRDPTLDGAQVSQALRDSQRPVAALAGLEAIYRFGLLDPELALSPASLRVNCDEPGRWSHDK